MENRRAKGNKGEDMAAEQLIQAGYELIERNFYCPFGEIDIIALKNQELFFVEVRSKSSGLYGSPGESLDFRKKKHWQQAAQAYLGQKNICPICHFILAAVDLKKSQVELIEDFLF